MRKILIALVFLTAVGKAAAEATDSTKQGAADSALVRSVVDLQAQTANLQAQLIDLDKNYLGTQRAVNASSRLKISGYTQIQWQYAGSDGIPSRAGGTFPFNVSNFANPTHRMSSPTFPTARWTPLAARQRFQIRRARVKFTYDAGTSKSVLEFNLAPSGLSIEDANIMVIDPWLKTFRAMVGIMDRPFGFEVPYPSASLETPERSRVAQTVFPGEKDLGAQLEARPTRDMGLLQYFDLKGGLFTGMGGNTPNFDEVDDHLDFIGRAGFQAPLNDFGLEIDGGVSTYWGKVTDRNDSEFSMKDTSLVLTFGNKDKAFDRKVFGADMEIYCEIPVLGTATLRGEYLWGKMPGTLGNNGPYDAPVWPTTALFERNMKGWYILWAQNLGMTLQAVVRYDVFDPNTDITGADVIQTLSTDISHPLSGADLKFSTLGFGLNYNWDRNLKLTAYYDILTNEKASTANADRIGDNQYENPSDFHPNPLAPYKKDLDDNVFTFRAQYQF